MAGMAARTPFDDVLAALSSERAALRARHDAGMGGLELARALSDSMDGAIRAIWERVAGDEPGLAVVALGGYGRGELSPHSDLDLMVLNAGRKPAGEIAQRLFYALWDAGFKVGHAVRGVKDCVRLAKENLEAETSFLEPRLLTGDKALCDEFVEATLRATRKRRDRFVADVREMMRARHVSGGSATSQLEPNLKEGAGGLRDLHVLRWFDRVLGDLREAGLVSAREATQLDHAAELLHRVRNHLHYTTDHPTDVFAFQHQRPTALHLGYADNGRPAEDELMRDLFAATRAVEHVVTTVVTEIAGEGGKRVQADGYAIERGRVVIASEPDLAREPERALELFTFREPPGAAALRWLEAALEETPSLAWTDATRKAFFRLLRAGDPLRLEQADHAGVFGALLPEWEEVRCQPQRNVYHRFTVDAHLFNTVAECAALERGDDPLARDVVADTSDRDLLLLACLLHDIGKGTDEDHAIRGERMARAICARMGIEGARAETAAWLVRHHLLLAEAATRRDLNDENLVVDVAERIGDPQRARMLYLMSVADGRATGPTAWSPWKAALCAELFTKVVHVLERGELAGRDASELAHLRLAELRDALTRYPPDAVERHIAAIPRAYVLAFPTTTLIRHFALMATPLEATDARTHVLQTDEPGVYELTVVTRDRPGLFSKVSGVLALNGINIVGAQASTRSDGVAVEVFRCVGAHETQVDERRWERVTEDVRRALAGKLSLAARLAEKRAAYERRVRKGKDDEPKVIVDNQASDFLTVIEVHCPDRVGLLYDITTALSELSLDIALAKISTYGEDVVDVFYVRDLTGQRVSDPEQVAEIERSLLHRIRARD